MRHLSVVFLLAVSIPMASAAEWLLPVVVFNWPGVEGNVWSSELYVTNVSAVPATASYAGFLPGHVAEPNEPCQLRGQGFANPFVNVPSGETVLWSSEDLAGALECSQQWIGAMRFELDDGVVIRSRLVNHAGTDFYALNRGFGQSMDAQPIDELAPGAFQLPLIWHIPSVHGGAFGAYFGVANPNSTPVRVEIAEVRPEGEGLIWLDGATRQLPYTVEVEAESWRQFQVAQYPFPWAVPHMIQLVDLRLITDAPVALYGSVVDRSHQDPRTVIPIRLY